MKQELFLSMIHTAIVASMISTQIIQKIKHTLNISRKWNKVLSIFISFGVGCAYSISFYSSKVLYALWIGLFTLIGAESIYRNFNGFFGLKSSSIINNKDK